MTKKEFEEKLEEKCFYGTGGGIVRRYYLEASTDPTALKESVECLDELAEEQAEEIEENMKKGMKDEGSIKRLQTLSQIMIMPKNTIPEILEAFDLFFEDGSFPACPELIGSLIGACAYHHRYKLAYDFLGIDNVKDQMYWDS